MTIKELMMLLDSKVPFNTAESWDNVGLLIGDETEKVSGILTALDCTEAVVDEAIELNYNTIISHHPLIFKGVQSIENKGYGKIIRKLIQHNINLIAMHTNLDVNPVGVNYMLAKILKLNHIRQINQQQHHYFKVQTYIPKVDVKTFKDNLSQAGLAQEGNYEYCFFETEGLGQFKPVGNANPHIGEIDKIEYVEEVKVEFMIDYGQKDLTEQLIKSYHPYETPVYDFIEMVDQSDYGLGIMGELTNPMSIQQFSEYAKKQLQIPSVRFVGQYNEQIQTIAIIGGSGIGFEYKAKSQGADIFVTGDVKHHDALDAAIQGVNLLDINHYSEYVMKQGLKTLLDNWFEDLNIDVKVKASLINTDPFHYV
ncbi:Nif3-like dinuclear metal center hexameric protein [Staphylococcus simiae]|uniref:Nif3-like dinuclear metal center hexameric protein n=1 Tax=Staphylococcus simiae TaxID=308354 RepID=UPI001A9656DA|nr:Nif3-like dinuclear metal center hexameric protein [Staphylococcus simiae]MBO1197955.1 Nif3-like dinuclear metal center hexameric protein [Staphylococcus simiae]MBO1200432.1 Nif3-like dinuclear metal center hexameric protein [Staphylococcus simiae]MBO1202705.1 Nif3-like dinuclear metal center hexameric protein [Staphylococcus simiae]MBO1209946.1 Nif3-like dinuclear metal center hexameric protein [Staphylococcus simiae]MBO1228849.1 Nif3-like dinuclear metal center hexameric protein [Staphylo